MRLEYKPEAVKQLKELPFPEKKKIIKKLELLSNNPYCGKALRGELEGLRSLRAWPYRIVYEINGHVLIVLSIAHRQSVY